MVTAALMSRCPVVEVEDEAIHHYWIQAPWLQQSPRVFFKEQFGYFTDSQLRECAWLDLRAGNSLKLPYLGYLELDITILGKCVTRRGVGGEG